jgi:hypothetical protein
MITPQDIRDRYPEFASVTDYPDARIQTWITKGVGELDETAWGDQYDEGLLAFTAHYLSWSTSVTGNGGSGGSLGPVAAKSIGDVSVTFAGMGGEMTQQEAFFRSTPYGQEYWRMVLLYGVGMLAV